MKSSVELMRAMIRNRCVNDGSESSGHEARSVRTLQDFFGVRGEVFEPAPERQSLVYRVKGSDAAAPSLVLAPHLDVVPVEPSGWSVDPFAAELRDGVVYGRGAVDMLNVTAAMAWAARPYINGGRQPRGDLVFCALADEESGGRYGAIPLVEERWDLVGADFLLTEVAYPALRENGATRIPVSVGEKGAYWSTISATGTPGHGSAPYGADSAVSKLVQALIGLLSTPMPAALGSEWDRFVEALPLEESSIQDLKDIDRLDSAIDEIAVADPDLARYLHASTHLTVSPNVIVGGTKTNVIPDRASSSLDIRSLPGMDRDFVDAHLNKAMGSASDQVTIEPIADNPANISSVGNRLWDAIADSVEELDGHRNLVPTVMTVASDARFWRAKGTVAYGVGLFDDSMTFGEMLALFHGNDERISAESVERTTRLYERVLYHFLES